MRMTSVPVEATADSSRVTDPVQPLANKLRGVPTADTRGATPMENAKRSGGNAVNAEALVLIRRSGIPRMKSNVPTYVPEFFIFRLNPLIDESDNYNTNHTRLVLQRV